MNGSSVVSARGVSFAYGLTQVLSGVDLDVSLGEFVALVGANGSGKSSLLAILLGLQSNYSGNVALFGSTPRELEERWRIGYVPQRATVDPALPASVGEVVAAGRLSRKGWWTRLDSHDRYEIDHALESVALTSRRNDRLSELSGGQQQRALIAKALVSRPDLLVLDEPVAGVDLESQRLFRDALVHLVAEHRSAVLLVSHELGAVAADLDRVAVLRGGRIVFDGPPAELTARGVSLGIHPADLPLWLETAPTSRDSPAGSPE